jgi:hypothetical protein
MFKDLSRENLEFVVAWSVHWGCTLRQGSIGHIESGIKWEEPDHEWMALDEIFCDAKYADDPVEAILMHKPLHDAYNEAMEWKPSS